MADRIHRVTMFKIPKPEDQQRLVEQYKKLEASQQKDGKPYILSVVVGAAEPDPRSQGYTIVSKTEFASEADLRYYVATCPAHQELKALCATLQVDGVLTVFFKPQVTGGLDQRA